MKYAQFRPVHETRHTEKLYFEQKEIMGHRGHESTKCQMAERHIVGENNWFNAYWSDELISHLKHIADGPVKDRPGFVNTLNDAIGYIIRLEQKLGFHDGKRGAIWLNRFVGPAFGTYGVVWIDENRWFFSVSPDEGPVPCNTIDFDFATKCSANSE